jgi:hypothetical protein
MTIAYPVYSRLVMPPAPLGFHHTTTQRASTRGTWSRCVTHRKAATVGSAQEDKPRPPQRRPWPVVDVFIAT